MSTGIDGRLTGFPADFVWGAATAAYQIEGGTLVDGRGESIWDRFCRLPGKVENGDSGDPACEHYFRWREDLELMRSLGLGGYRFSISWPRIQPEGRGPVNRKGLDFYRRLVEGLLEREIRPLATLYHWDLPQALEDEGGWAARSIVDRFAEYARLVFDGLGDLVPEWITHNEPWVTSFLGYAYGVKAPGVTEWRAALAASHHALLSHGEAVRAFREGGYPGRIGIALDLTVAHGATSSPDDRLAAERLEGHHNRWFLEPVLRGSYPSDMLALYEERFGPIDAIQEGDLEATSRPIDMLGVNFYRPSTVALGDGGGALGLHEVEMDGERTAMGWPISAPAFAELLLALKRDYGDMPILITENGAAFDDHLDGGDVVDDSRRLAYLKGHLEALAEAIAAGVDVRGYYVWSLLDNFEWEHGYSKRFGIVYVDYASQRRVPKRSALWYRDLIAQQPSRRS